MWGKETKALRVNDKGQVLDPSKAGAPQKVPKVEREMARLRAQEDRLYAHNLDIFEAATVGAASYDDDEPRSEVTPEEVAAHGSITAALRYKRVAMDSRRSKKHAPVYLENAKAIVASISRQRAAESRNSGGEMGPTINVFINEQNNFVQNKYTEEEVVDEVDD